MAKFDVEINCPGQKLTDLDVHKILAEHFLMKLKSEGVVWKDLTVKVLEIKENL